MTGRIAMRQTSVSGRDRPPIARVGIRSAMPMSYRAIYAYAWDIAERGVGASSTRSRGLGLNTVTLAGSLSRRQVPPAAAGPAARSISPRTAPSISAPIRHATAASSRSRTASSPSTTSSPSWPRPAARGQCVDGAPPQYAARRGLSGRDGRERLRRPLRLLALPVQPGCARICGRALPATSPTAIRSSASRSRRRASLPYAHGFHHEFALMKQNRWFDNQLGLCFCDHCRRRARRRPASTPTVCARRVRDRRRSPGSRPTSTCPTTWPRRSGSPTRGPTATSARFLAWRCDVVTSLVSEIRAAVRQRRGGRGHPVGGAADRRRLVRGQRPRGARRSRRHHRGLLLRAERRARARRCLGRPAAARAATGQLRGILRPAHPDLNSARRGRRGGRRRCTTPASPTSPSTITAIFARRASRWIGEALAALGS